MPFVRALMAALAAVCLFALATLPAAARLVIDIDKSAQRMTVTLDGEPIHRWPVSTGLRAYDTPSGSYTPFRLEEDHFSREWDDAPMPHSIFFTKRGHAIHGTTHLRNIGRPASHGCVRLEPENARVLFGLVKRHGLPNTRVVLHGEVPASAPAVARRAPDDGDRPSAAAPRDPRQYDTRQHETRQYDRRYGGGDPYSSPRRAAPSTRDDEDPPYYAPRHVEPNPPRVVREYTTRQYYYSRPDSTRSGYWLRRPDGSWLFVDREPEYRPSPRYFYGNR